MTENVENELKRKMGIESWRNLSKEKFLTFVSDLPDVNKEVALKIVGQFPDFKNLVLDSLSTLEEQANRGIETNWKSQKRVHKAYEHYRLVLTNELDRNELSAEDRFRILALLRESIVAESDKDSEHKAFITNVMKYAGIVALAGMSAGAAILGSRQRGIDRD